MRCLRAGGYDLLPGGPGISLPALGPAREVHRWKWLQCRRAGPPAAWVPQPRSLARVAPWGRESLGPEPRWNAGRRAGALTRGRIDGCGGWTRRLSAFRFPFASVTAEQGREDERANKTLSALTGEQFDSAGLSHSRQIAARERESFVRARVPIFTPPRRGEVDEVRSARPEEVCAAARQSQMVNRVLTPPLLW